MSARVFTFLAFFFNDTATTEIYTLSLHDALPISMAETAASHPDDPQAGPRRRAGDRKSTRLNSSHGSTSYAVFCLKKTQSTTKATRPAPTSPPHSPSRRHRIAP